MHASECLLSNNLFIYFGESFHMVKFQTQLITHLLKMSKCELSLEVLQTANFSQITHSSTFGRAFTW